MRAMVGLLIGVALIYQLFFRYEHWTSPEHAGLVYERDNLTGETHQIEPNRKINFLNRLVGSRYALTMQSPPDEDYLTALDPAEAEHYHLSMIAEKKNKQSTKAIPTAKEVVVASSAPPVPGHPEARFAVRQIDLNLDGTPEEVIQNALQSDGLLDISIVKSGREIFFARGTQIAMLPKRSNEGWTDIVLSIEGKPQQIYRYNVKAALYQPLVKSKEAL